MIIAEAGINHNGDLGLAMRMIDAAIEAGADAVKFQTYKAERLAPPGAKRDMLKRCELNEAKTRTLKDYCDRRALLFLSTPFDKDSVDFLDGLVPMFKIGSGQSNDSDFLEHVSKKGKPMLISTGMSEFSDIRRSLAAVKAPVTLLHCVSKYPTPAKEANLRRMQNMMFSFPHPVGYSDHTEGIEIALAAKALGAVVIEKHITLDKGMEGPDHRASITPEELKALVLGVKKIEQSLLMQPR